MGASQGGALERTLRRSKAAALSLCIVPFTGVALAATISSNGTGGGAWNATGTWAGHIVPVAGDDVIISAGDQVNLSSDQTCATLGISGTLQMSANNRTLTITSALTFNGTGSVIGNGATRTITVNGTMLVNSGATTSISGCVFGVGGTTTVNGTLTFASNTASRTFTGDLAVHGGLRFVANVALSLGARLVAYPGSTVGGGGSTGTITAAAHLLVVAGGVATLDSINLNCGGTSNIQGTARLLGGSFTFNALSITGGGVLDASGAANAISLSGNWGNTSTAGDPFVEGTTSTVTFNGSSGTQTISTNSPPETFNALVIANTSPTSPGVRMLNDVAVTDDMDHSAGILDLAGNALTITGSSTARTFGFTGGRMMSSTTGGTFTVTDPSNVDRINLTGYRIGDSAHGVTLSVTCGRIFLTDFTQWGTASFTKTLAQDDVFGGGNYYHGPVTFTADPTASRWRMGDNLAVPDTFVNATFNANALGGSNNNFIICTNSQGNAFYGTTSITSTTSGGFFVCRANGHGASSATFFGPVSARVTLTGNITFAEGDTNFVNTVTFQNTVQARSAASSTGDIYFGTSGFSKIQLTATGQFIQGTLQGMTSVHFRHVLQTGTLPQTTIGISNSRIYCGGTNYPNSFDGAVSFRADTLQVLSTTFNSNVDLWGLSHLTFGYSTFNGTTNTFSKQGVGNSSSAGGNTFAAGSANTFSSYGGGYMRLATSQPDDMNGDATYFQSGGGALVPAYGTNCTYAGLISTAGSPNAIQFGVGGGTVTLDGASQLIDGDAATPPLFYRLTTALSGTLTLHVPATVRNVLTMNSGVVDLANNLFTLGIATGTPGTLTRTAGWLFNGPMKRWVPTTAIAIGAANGLFPLGSSGTDYHPFWFGSTSNLSTGGTITVQHTPTTSGHANANFADASWGSVVLGVSNAAWVVSTGNSLAVNGSTAAVRFGGTGFTPFVLTDLDAVQQSGVVGTFAASTNAAVPLEVNRTGLNTAALTRTWRIGTRNPIASPLPVELLYFSAAPNGEVVDLEWSTASEHDNDHFTVERSADGQTYTELLRMPGAGNSTQTLLYHATDAQPVQGDSYYRLKQVDTDGHFTYSDAVPVYIGGPGRGVFLFPNPSAMGPLTLVLPHAPERGRQLFLRITAVDGRVVDLQALPADGSAAFTLERALFNGGAAGLYHVSVTGDGRTQEGSIVLQ